MNECRTAAELLSRIIAASDSGWANATVRFVNTTSSGFVYSIDDVEYIQHPDGSSSLRLKGKLLP